MCKDHKFKDHGRAVREPAPVLRELGTTKRVRRGDLGEWEPHPRGARRKNTRRWCRGKVGVPHTLAVREGDPKERVPEWFKRCGPNPWTGRWRCAEQEYCTSCGKIMRRRVDHCSKRPSSAVQGRNVLA